MRKRLQRGEEIRHSCTDVIVVKDRCDSEDLLGGIFDPFVIVLQKGFLEVEGRLRAPGIPIAHQCLA